MRQIELLLLLLLIVQSGKRFDIRCIAKLNVRVSVYRMLKRKLITFRLAELLNSKPPVTGLWVSPPAEENFLRIRITNIFAHFAVRLQRVEHKVPICSQMEYRQRNMCF